MEPALNTKSHMNNTIKSCNAQIHKISKIRKYLTIDAAKTIVHALITSRLDNLNSLLYDLPEYELERLQKLQNNAARLIYKQPREKKHNLYLENTSLVACPQKNRLQNTSSDF